MAAKRSALYLVQEILWDIQLDEFTLPIWALEEDWQGWDSRESIRFRCGNPNQGRPVKLFGDRKRAERFRVECEARLQWRNPFLFGGQLKDLTTMPAGVFHDWLLEAELTPPPGDSGNLKPWRNWWRQRADMTEEQRAKVWQALDKARFFTVVPLETFET